MRFKINRCVFLFIMTASCYADDLHLFEKILHTAEQGDSNAQFMIGYMYEVGKEVQKNEEEAVKWYRKAAEQGNANGQDFLGQMYSQGIGIPENDEEAVKWYRKAAEQGHKLAQRSLGAMYYNGEGVARNYVSAYKWISFAAAQGAENAQQMLNSIENVMTREQIAEAQKMARVCLTKNFKGCD